LVVLVSNRQVRVLGLSLKSRDTAANLYLDESGPGELSLYLTQISVNTDGVIMLSLCGLETGQIFLGGRDGHLYELEYEVSYKQASFDPFNKFICILFLLKNLPTMSALFINIYVKYNILAN
jgi:hypothetical protein